MPKILNKIITLWYNQTDLKIVKDILLITPSFTQLNTPYPATAFLKGFFNTKGIESYQMDLGIEVILEMFSKKGLSSIFKIAKQSIETASDNSKRIFSLKQEYIDTIENTILFLQGNNRKYLKQICNKSILPEASRFGQLESMGWMLDEMLMEDRAKFLATLYLEDLSDFIAECVDSNFGFSRYAEKLGRSANSFDELNANLQNELSLIDTIGIKIIDSKLKEINPKLICLSVPFPGNLFSAFRIAQHIKQNYPELKIAMGGGFASTELRSVSDVRVFDYFDFISLDDGELPLELIINCLLGSKSEELVLKRTFLKHNDEVFYNNLSSRNDYPPSEVGTPDYSDLPLEKYISVMEMLNPMHSLWSDGRWNKLMMAHGCYWGKCAFCDISLSYIKNYKANSAEVLVNRMEAIIAQTGETGFHFIDEAAPPSLMRSLASEIIKRNLNVTWWTNVRFEEIFTLELCQLLAKSGCIAVAGGLEVASNRLLKLINKGVSVEQVAKVAANITKAGIMVHSYLMYGFPSQTEQETIDSLEMVRQMFELGIIHSGFWHQFALTAHSDVGLNPEKYNITPKYAEITFANNDIEFTDSTGIDHSKFSFPLKKSIYNFMHGIGFDIPLQDWFDFPIPETQIPKCYIQNIIDKVYPKATF